MPSTKQRRAPAERPGEIIDSALSLFVEKGFAATRLDDVAERAGLSKAAIYLYFADKTALFQGVIQQAVGRNLGMVEAMLAQHRGIYSLGCVMTTGLATCMVAGLTFLPALLNLLMRPGEKTKQPSADNALSTLGREEPR